MKKGEFVIWRYHGELSPRFGVIEKNETFHYSIKDLCTGEIEHVAQSYVTIIIDDKKYGKIKDLDKNKLYTKKEIHDICGISEDDTTLFSVQSYINFQDFTGGL